MFINNIIIVSIGNVCDYGNYRIQETMILSSYNGTMISLLRTKSISIIK